MEKRPENKEVSKLLGKAFGVLKELRLENTAMVPAYVVVQVPPLLTSMARGNSKELGRPNFYQRCPTVKS